MKVYIYCIISLVLFSCNTSKNYYKQPTFSQDNILNAVIEIPSGTNKKFEYNKKSREFEIDKKNGIERIIKFLPYLGNYGFIPSTLSDPKKGGDGDALDILVLSESVRIGSIIEVIPIGVLKLIDDGELDYKIVAIPYDKSKRIIDAETFIYLSNNYPEVIDMIEIWFLNYNKDEEAKIQGWGNEKDAMKEINLLKIK